MKRARAFGFWGLSIVCAASFVYACSSSSSSVTGGGTGGGGNDATTGDDGSSYGGDDGSTTTDSGGSNKDGSTADDSGGGGPCGSTSSYDDCVTCCDGYSDGGVSEFYQLQFECLCGPGKCDTKTKCKNSFCADPNTADAGAACSACIDKNLADDAGDAGCQDPVFNECAADMGCAMGIECVIDSNCGAKP